MRDMTEGKDSNQVDMFDALLSSLGARKPTNTFFYTRNGVFKRQHPSRGVVGGGASTYNPLDYAHPYAERWPDVITIRKHNELDRSLRYPKITNYVITFKLKVVIDLYRVSAHYPNVERGCDFVALIIRIGATFLIFASGVVVGPGCKTYYSAKYLSHCVRVMIESVPQPVVIIDQVNSIKKLQLRTLQGMTSFDDFKVRNIVANGSLSDHSIDLAKQEQDNKHLVWNPRYFPGLKVLVTEKEVPELGDVVVTVQEFDRTANGVCMGGRKVSHVYLSFQYVANCVKKYVDFNVPKDSSLRYKYRCDRKNELARSKQRKNHSNADNLCNLYSTFYKRIQSQISNMDQVEKANAYRFNTTDHEKRETSTGGMDEYGDISEANGGRRLAVGGGGDEEECNDYLVSNVLEDLDAFLNL